MKRKGVRILLTGIIALLLLFSTIPLAGCFGTTEEPAPAPSGTAKSITNLENRAKALEKAVSNLQGQTASEVTQAEVDSLSTQLESLQTALDTAKNTIATQDNAIGDLENAVADLEDEVEELSGGQTGSIDWEPVKWYLTVTMDATYPDTIPNYIDIKVVDKDPYVIREEGDYEIRVHITNTSLTEDWDMGELEIELVLKPREYSPINQRTTDLDSERAPWLDWDKRFVMRSTEELCKRIVFTSDEEDFEHILLAGKHYRLDLVLELYYD